MTLVAVGAILPALVVAYAAYAYHEVSTANGILQGNILELQGTADTLSQALATTSIDLASTTQALAAAEGQNSAIEPQLNQLSGTVNSLQTLASIDPQLLEKYSEVYFLNENYVPASLSPVATQYLYDTSKPQLFLTGALPDLEALLAGAGRAGVALQVISGYRSFYQQGALKLDYTETYGSGANQFSADQGYSEHQLGTAVDFGMQGAQNLRSGFASSTGYAWLVGNAYQYGFELSYPPGNVYYEFEPWHWRYVGVALATYLHGNNEYFYNMSQRDINSYLISFFQ